MDYVRRHGYPSPAVEELQDDDTAMVLERVEGASMVDVLRRRPWTVRHQGRVLADLHRRLHAISAPEWLPEAPCGQGEQLLHMDLHPLNVLIGPAGPVVIDWTGASRGEAGVDVALAWVLMSAGGIPGGRVAAAVLGLGRSLLVGSFLGGVEVDGARRLLPEVVEWKCQDPHMSSAEQAGMRQVAARASGAGPG
jgi:aminoglycoside phosphotransferase (APT) family kinase protein